MLYAFNVNIVFGYLVRMLMMYTGQNKGSLS
jgi:hypothetical protein